MKQKSRVGETRLSLPKSISPSSDSLSTATHVAIKYTDDFIPNLSRIPHESIPSLSPTSFAADFNLKANESTRKRVIFYTVGEYIFLAAASGLQVLYIRKLFSKSVAYNRV
ncbi:hypothetical protein F2Q68_00003343 [Brassica cretica]|uniref:GOLD domain-containing protein n=1 Tax=Brassica cretica TaxID=69181 RepID=A0A8S9JA54_BRACR|nr:hypothetical protein F2Q68_00003343 [Brassica cretica]